MKNSDACKLKKGQEVMHNRYGKSIVKEVVMSFGELFGVVITPTNENGRNLLAIDCGSDIPDFLEDSARFIQYSKE